MNRLRFWTTALIIWLIFVFNIERINSPINIKSYTYIFIALAAVLALVWHKTSHLSYLALIFIPAPSFVLFKLIWRGDTVFGEALPLTVTQVGGIVLTGLIARQISYGLRDVQQVVNNVTTAYIGKLPPSFSEAQGAIYKELRRARRHHRPLSVITLDVDPEVVKVALPRMIKETQRAMMNEYILAGIARILDNNVTDFGTIALRDNQFIVVLPEITDQEAPLIAQSLRSTVQEKMNIKLQTGTASFPTEAVTFEALIDLAANKANHLEHSEPAQTNLQQQPQTNLLAHKNINGSNSGLASNK
jgi:GGDEF domain-containing protein